MMPEMRLQIKQSLHNTSKVKVLDFLVDLECVSVSPDAGGRMIKRIMLLLYALATPCGAQRRVGCMFVVTSFV